MTDDTVATAVPATSRSEPRHALASETRTMWICEALGQSAMLVVLAVVAATSVRPLFPWLALAAAVAAVAYTIAVPPLRHRRWRWELHEEELDLVRGVWRVVRTIVPITRIQHVSVERTGWTSTFGVVRVHVHTAAGRTTIPGLLPATADELRDSILERLRTPDDL